jgi:DinB superfamily
MNASQWFSEQLQHSADTFVWTVRQLPPARQYVPPPRHPEEWPAARHVFHMLYYERGIALPFMRYWLGETLPELAGYYENEDAAWKDDQGYDLEQMLTQFQAVRNEQIQLLPQFSDAAWDEIRETVWGFVPLRWVVTKTLQHTYEHIHDVLRMMLFWDAVRGKIPAKGA